MKPGFIAECERFARCSTIQAAATELGMRQFHAMESDGKSPETPDPFFHVLRCGKAWWEWTINQIAGTYGTDEWIGWEALRNDYRSDPRGFQQIEARIRRA